jgi:hypothetical protein
VGQTYGVFSENLKVIWRSDRFEHGGLALGGVCKVIADALLRTQRDHRVDLRGAAGGDEHGDEGDDDAHALLLEC